MLKRQICENVAVTLIIAIIIPFLAPIGTYAQWLDNSALYVNEEQVELSHGMQKQDGNVYIPTRDFAAALKLSCEWNETEKSVLLEDFTGNMLTLYYDNSYYYYNGIKVVSNSKNIIFEDDYSLVNASLVCDLIGAEVDKTDEYKIMVTYDGSTVYHRSIVLMREILSNISVDDMVFVPIFFDGNTAKEVLIAGEKIESYSVVSDGIEIPSKVFDENRHKYSLEILFSNDQKEELLVINQKVDEMQEEKFEELEMGQVETKLFASQSQTRSLNSQYSISGKIIMPSGMYNSEPTVEVQIVLTKSTRASTYYRRERYYLDTIPVNTATSETAYQVYYDGIDDVSNSYFNLGYRIPYDDNFVQFGYYDKWGGTTTASYFSDLYSSNAYNFSYNSDYSNIDMSLFCSDTAETNERYTVSGNVSLPNDYISAMGGVNVNITMRKSVRTSTYYSDSKKISLGTVYLDASRKSANYSFQYNGVYNSSACSFVIGYEADNSVLYQYGYQNSNGGMTYADSDYYGSDGRLYAYNSNYYGINMPLIYNISPPYASKSSGTYVPRDSKIYLYTSSSGTIYYTLDGTTPTRNSIRYSDGITITDDTTVITAVTINAAGYAGETAQYIYYAQNPITYEEINLPFCVTKYISDRLSTRETFGDGYKIYVSAGQTITIDMMSNAFDCYLYLFDEYGNIICSDDDGGGNGNSYLTHTFTRGGTYYIEATQYDQSAGTYTLNISIDGNTYNPFDTGTGEKNNPYIISTAEQLKYLATSVNSGNDYWGVYFKLANDIVLNTPNMFKYDNNGNITGAAYGKAPEEWTAIGYDYHPFCGTFDGDNHEIKGIYINKPDTSCQGLFGYCEDATVKNVGVSSGYICGGDVVGGIVGRNDNGTVLNCYNTATVAGNEIVGGVVGQNGRRNGTLINCHNTGSVTGDFAVGGILALNCGTVTNCYNAGNVTESDHHSIDFGYGGIVGFNDNIILNSYNTGSVTGDWAVGGIVGQNTDIANVTNCYNIGNVACSDIDAGGIVGYNYNGTVTSSYYNSETTGQNDTGKGIPATTVEMKNQNTYVGWDFDDVWGILPDICDGYPYLRALTSAPEKVSKPTASVASGEVLEGTKVSLSTVTNGADIYYTLNGTTPTASSTKYTGAITINTDTTIKAIAVKSGMLNSDIAEFTYEVLSVTNEDIACEITVGETTAIINGKIVDMEVEPVLIDGYIYSPIRYFAEAINATVEWNGDSKQVKFQKGTNAVTLTLGDGNCCIINDRTYANVVFVLSRLLGTEYIIEHTSTSIKVYKNNSNQPTITVGNIKGRPGKTVDLTLSLENNPGIISMLLNVDYNSSVLTLTNVADAGVLRGQAHSDDYTRNPYVLYWNDGSATQNCTANGSIVTLTFEVDENAPEGDYPITISYDKYNDEILNIDLKPVDFSIINGKVTVSNILCGDVNGDWKVTALDNAILARYIAKWTGYDNTTVIRDAADVNEDGKVTALDNAILARYIAKWTGYDKLPYVK